MKISVLEQIIHYEQQDINLLFQELIPFAQHLESLGYQRLWFAEHHNSSLTLSSNPDIIMTYILAHTEILKIGSGGTLIANYNPLQVAERFLLLSTIYPNRIDLGIGLATHKDQIMATALNQPTTHKELLKKLADLINFIEDSYPKYHSYKDIKIATRPTIKPQLFLLGSSGLSLPTASKNHLNYAFAHFFNGKKHPSMFDFYKQQSKEFVGITISCIAIFADYNYQDALKQAKAFYYLKKYPNANFVPNTYSLDEEKVLNDLIKEDANNTAFIGTYEQAIKYIKEFQQIYKCDEIMILSYHNNLEKKLEFYTELSMLINKK